MLDAAIGIEGAYVGHSWEPKRWREEAEGVVGQGCRAFAAVVRGGFAVGLQVMRGEGSGSGGLEESGSTWPRAPVVEGGFERTVVEGGEGVSDT